MQNSQHLFANQTLNGMDSSNCIAQGKEQFCRSVEQQTTTKMLHRHKRRPQSSFVRSNSIVILIVPQHRLSIKIKST
jgi:hypothetical protein